MDEPAHPSSGRTRNRRTRRTLILVTVILAVVAGLIGIGVYGLLRGPDIGEDAPGTPSSTGSTTPTVPVPTRQAASPASVPSAVDPRLFARQVAAAVFTWDTATGYTPADYIQAIVNVGDPSGNETPGLAADLAGYLPGSTAWTQLRRYETRQWLSIDTASVPTSWGQALQQGTTLLPGTTAVTITGTRHRAGVWDGAPVTTAERVSFTVFETCKPTYPSCRLLRLSQLGNPLR